MKTIFEKTIFNKIRIKFYKKNHIPSFKEWNPLDIPTFVLLKGKLNIYFK